MNAVEKNTLENITVGKDDYQNTTRASNVTSLDNSSDRQGVGKEHEIYTQRFTPEEEAVRQASWDVLVSEFFQNYVSPEFDTVVDIGAGDGLFTKRIKAKRKIAVDLSQHVQELKKDGIEVYQVSADKFTQHVPVLADVIFMSNFLEHLPDKSTLIRVLEECNRGLRKGGSLLILQPNIHYVGNKYWDYIDHHIALTEHSLVEALDVTGFEVVQVIPRFLPYTSKSLTGHLIAKSNMGEQLARWYLRFPILWRIFGAQTFVAATPRR